MTAAMTPMAIIAAEGILEDGLDVVSLLLLFEVEPGVVWLFELGLLVVRPADEPVWEEPLGTEAVPVAWWYYGVLVFGISPRMIHTYRC